MKTIALLVIFLMMSATVLIGNSYGENIAPRDHPSLHKVSLQLVVRNSDGQLVAYIEPTVMYIRNIVWTHEYLDKIPNKRIIIEDGKNLELIQFQRNEKFDKVGQMATYGLVSPINGKNEFVLLFRHDAYIAAPGDTVTAYWKIIRSPL